MSKKLIFSLLFFLFAFITQAQIEGKFKENCIQAGAENYIFGTLVNVRSYMATDTNIIAKLPIATKVQVLEITYAKEEINGFWSPWCKIAFEQGDSIMAGYILAAMLSTSWLRNEKGELFLISANQFASKVGVTIQVRVAHKNRLIASQEFVPWGTTPKAQDKGTFDSDSFYEPDGLFSLSAKLMGSQGLDSVQNTVVVRSKYAYCTFGNEDFILLWNGKELAKGFPCYFGFMSPSTFSSTVTFPTGKTKEEKNQIKLIEKEIDAIEDKDGNLTDKVKVNYVKTTIYHWNGKTLIKK